MHDTTRVAHTLAVGSGVLPGLVTFRGGAPSSYSPTPRGDPSGNRQSHVLRERKEF